MSLSREPQDYQIICAHIGHLSLKWAMAESALDTVVFLAHAVFGGKEIAELPRSFRLKPPYLRAVFAAKPEFISYLNAIEPILAEASDIAQQRNTIVHGILAVGPSGRIMQHIYRADRENPRKQAVSIEKMDHLAKRCSQLTLAIMEFTADPLGIMSADQIDDFRRAFPVKD